ncbi:hypothetical protein Tco_0795686 [Tanacetum coccineum]
MTIAKYMEYEARMKRQYVHPTRCEGADFNYLRSKSVAMEYSYYSDDAKIDLYYALPPLLPSQVDGTDKLQWVSFVADEDVLEGDIPSEFLPCQLPPKELNPGSFTLPCTIGNLNLYDMVDLGASVNVMSESKFEHLKV